MNIYEVAFDMSKQNVERQLGNMSKQQTTCIALDMSNATSCLLLRHAAGVDGA